MPKPFSPFSDFWWLEETLTQFQGSNDDRIEVGIGSGYDVDSFLN